MASAGWVDLDVSLFFLNGFLIKIQIKILNQGDGMEYEHSISSRSKSI